MERSKEALRQFDGGAKVHVHVMELGKGPGRLEKVEEIKKTRDSRPSRLKDEVDDSPCPNLALPYPFSPHLPGSNRL